jgi:hypothetical protein
MAELGLRLQKSFGSLVADALLRWIVVGFLRPNCCEE